MRSIAKEAEEHFEFKKFFYYQKKDREYQDISAAIAISSVEATYSSNVKAIFIITSSGFTARLVSRLRPKVPIIAFTIKEKIYHHPLGS